MDKDEIEKIKEEKKKELQEGQAQQQEEMQKKLEQKRKEALRKILTKDARERLNRVKLANEALAQQLETYLVRIGQSGQVRDKIDEEKLKDILKSIKDDQEKDWNIKRK